MGSLIFGAVSITFAPSMLNAVAFPVPSSRRGCPDTADCGMVPCDSARLALRMLGTAQCGEVMDYRPHIVVVEDEATQRQLLVDYLTRQNFRVSGVDGGASLRKLAERELPTLVLLDVGLPGEDGFALARWLRE